MKKFLKYIAFAALLPLAFTACTPMEEDKPDMGKLPDIDAVQYEVVASEDAGYRMIFRILTPGVVGIWEFPGSSNLVTGIDVSRDFTFRGDYMAKLTVYNKAGVSSSSKTIEFTVPENNPEVAQLYDLLTASPWVWDKTRSGHIGNGPADAAAPAWWVAGPNEQDPKLYDDVMIFHTNNNYELQANGFVLCNESALHNFGLPNLGSGMIVPYTQPSGQQWAMTFEGNKKYLSFTNDGFPSYIACDGWGSQRYEILTLNSTTLSIKISFSWGAFFMRFVHPAA